MIVKKVGYVLLMKLKLYYIIKKLAPLLLLIGCLFTFTKFNFNHTKQRYQFQEPSLRTKIYEIAEEKSKSHKQTQIQFKIIYPGIKMIKFQGLLQNQCLLIVFPQRLQKSLEIILLYESLMDQKIISKNIVLINYNNPSNFQSFIEAYYNKQVGHMFDFGIIRQSLEINIQYSQTTKKDRAFLQIYSQTGVHSDLDFFQALKELLQSLHIQWSPCQKIYRNSIYKSLRKTFQKGINYISQLSSDNEQNSNIFIDSILCQLDKSLFTSSNEFNTSKPHIVMMNKGFQSSSIQFLISSFQRRNPLVQSKKKVSKFIYSFLNEFSVQQDHLHSATTLFYPISNAFFIPITGTLYGGLIILIVGLIKIIGEFAQNHHKLKLNINKQLFLFLFILIWEYFLTENISISFFIFIFLKPIFFQIKEHTKIQTSKEIQKRLWHLILAGIQFLFAIYLCIFNFSLFYMSVIFGIVILVLSRKKVIIGIIVLCFFGLFLKFKSQEDDLAKVLNNLGSNLQYCVFCFLNISTQVKLISSPIIFWLLG